MKPRTRKTAVLRPGAQGWELWTFRPGSAPSCERPAPSSPPTSGLVAALPTRDVVALPLWLPSDANFRELAELELSSRHLLRRGMEVHCLPIASAGARSLVLALAAEEDSSLPDIFRAAERFEAAPRTWPPNGADVVIWREESGLCFAVYRGDACVYFAGGSAGLGALCGAVRRALLRLRAEQVTEREPRLARLYGHFSEDDRKALLTGLGFGLEYHEEIPAPRLAEPSADLPPLEARERRDARRRRKRLLSIGALGGLAYAALFAVFAGSLAVDKWKISQLRSEASQLEAPASAAREEVLRWREIRTAIDPRTFALDLLAAVASQLPSDQVRLTIFSIESGRVTLSGEAPNVQQAYAFIENVRKSPALTEFDWTANQLQLAGKQIVRFEMEGRGPDAQVVQE